MKTIYRTTLASIFICIAFTTGFSQSSTTMQDILETVNTKVAELEDEKNQEVVNITIDLIVGQGKKSIYRYLDPSFGYTLTAIGDRRISKVKLSVYKKSKDEWEYVSEMSGSKPLIKIQPVDFEQYEITISVDDFKGSNTTGHFALILYHRNPEK